MLFQTDGGFRGTPIPRWGCYFMSLVGMVELDTGHVFTIADVLEAYHLSADRHHIDMNCYVGAPDGVLANAREIASKRDGKAYLGRIYQVGINDVQGERYWPWVPDKAREPDWVVNKLKTATGFHFTLGNNAGDEVFNPDPTVQTFGRRALVYYHKFG